MSRPFAPIIFTFLALHGGAAMTNVVDTLEFAKGGRTFVHCAVFINSSRVGATLAR